MSTMSRDEFELWLEENGPEALEHIDLEETSLAHWARLYGRALTLLAAQDQQPSGESSVDEDEDEPYEPDEEDEG